MDSSSLFDTFARVPIAIAHGEGSWVTTTDGRRLLDFTTGIAVNSLGHAHPALVAALTSQAGKVWHTSNLFLVPEQENLARLLTGASFADKVFFANSGAEVVECAIKTARRYQFVSGHAERNRIVTFAGAFHGRTMTTLAATNNPKYLEGFGPTPPGFDQVPLDDMPALEAALGPETAAILIEPIQGEGGVRLVPPRFMRALRQICDERGLLLVLDEVQTGIGRTGKLFAYEWSGIEPDILAVAKGLGGGFPIGACLATAEAAKGMTPGTHGSTFGGNPLAAAVAAAVVETVLGPGFLDHVARVGLYFKQRLARLVDEHPTVIDQVRGEGLLIGVRGVMPAAKIVTAMRDADMLAVTAGENVVRLLPPLNVTETEIDEGIRRFEAALIALEREAKDAETARSN